MRKLLTWREHFKSKWAGKSAPKDLEIALVEGYFSQDDYLEWAREYHQTCSVNPEYLESFQVNPEFWLEWKDAFTWSEFCIPLAVWEDHLLVAGVETVSLPANLKPIFVLASPIGLKKVWNLYKSSGQGLKLKIPGFKATEAPEALPSKELSLEEMMAAEASGVKKIPSENTNSVVLEPPSEDEFMAPEGLTAAPSIPANDFMGALPSDPVTLVHAGTTPTIAAQTLSSEKTKAPESVADELLTLRPPELPEMTATGVSPDLPAHNGVTKTFVPSAGGNIPSPPLPPVPAQKVSSPLQAPAQPFAQTVKTQTQTQTQTQSQTHSITNSIGHGSWLDLLYAKNPTLFQELSNKLFEDLKANYEHGMICSYDDDADVLKTLHWDSQFQATAAQSYRLDTPSFFKIVKNTEKPYHGYPTMNEFNEKFIEEWHAGDIPDHLTLIPILIESRLIGIVYMSGPKSSNSLQSLKFAEAKVQTWIETLLSRLIQPAA